jgi:predicted metalloprotease
MVQWRGRRQSGNIEDRRGRGGKLAVGGGLGAVLVVIAISLLTGTDPAELMQVIEQQGGTAGGAEPVPAGTPPPGDEQAEFVAVVLADTEDTWQALMPALGRSYQTPRLVLFEGSVSSACGMASSAVGPFYCPLDDRVYLDLTFFRDLDQRFGAPGDFARAYVIAHEVGHHVQNQLGISGRVHEQRQRLPEAQGNQLSVLLELQADCFAGVWANHAETQRDLLEAGDVEEGLDAAAAVGDDRLQERARGRVVPESFTHGSSAQRVEWFQRGLRSGDPASCDTFAAG